MDSDFPSNFRWSQGTLKCSWAISCKPFTEHATEARVGAHDTKLQGSRDAAFLRWAARCSVSKLRQLGDAPADLVGQRGSAPRPCGVAEQPVGSAAGRPRRSAQHSRQRAMARLLPLDRPGAVRRRDRGLSLSEFDMNAKNGMRPVHPGEVLRDELDELGLSANALSKALDVPVNRGDDDPERPARHERGHGAAVGAVFRDDAAPMAELAADLGASPGGARCGPRNRAACNASAVGSIDGPAPTTSTTHHRIAMYPNRPDL